MPCRRRRKGKGVRVVQSLVELRAITAEAAVSPKRLLGLNDQHSGAIHQAWPDRDNNLTKALSHPDPAICQ